MEKAEEKTIEIRKRRIMMAVLLFSVFSIGMQIILLGHSVEFCLKWSVFLALLGLISFFDIEEKRIPNGLLLALCGNWFLSLLIPFFKVESREALSQTFADKLTVFGQGLIGFGVGTIFLFLFRLIKGGGIGMGDIKLFGVLGFYFGAGGILLIMIASFLLASLVMGIKEIFWKKRWKEKWKEEFSLGPFIAICAVLFLFLT